MDIEGVSVFIFMTFQEHRCIRGYYLRENYCIHNRKIHEYIHGYIHIRVHVSIRTPIPVVDADDGLSNRLHYIFLLENEAMLLT
jgi:hypothetical protein